jgi:hypothetical protein
MPTECDEPPHAAKQSPRITSVGVVLHNEQLCTHILTHFLSLPDQLRYVQPVCR